MRLLLHVFLFAVGVSGLFSQAPAYLHYGVKDGLAGNIVYSGLQDHQGFLWFGTDKGLTRYDGTRFVTLGVEDGLPDPEILKLFSDSRGRLWVSCFRKRLCYRQNGRFVSEKEDPRLLALDYDLSLYDFFEDTRQNLWLSTYQARGFLFQDDTVHIVDYARESTAQYRQIGDDVLMLSNSGKIFRQDPDGHVQALNERIARGYRGVEVSGAYILYSFIDSLYLIRYHNNTIELKDRIGMSGGQIFTDKRGRFWSCSSKIGAVCFENNTGDLSNPVVYLPGKKVISVFEDNQGTLWFCTAGEGVYALPRQAPLNFDKSEGLRSNNITALCPDTGGRMLAGDDEGNVYFMDKNGIQTLPIGAVDGDNRCRQIIASPDGSYWFATDEGLYNYADRKLRLAQDKTTVKDIVQANDQIWVATHASLSRVTKPQEELKPVIERRRFTKVGVDSEGFVWAGGIEGLYSQYDSFQTNWADLFPDLKGRVVAIENAGEGKLWVATSNAGLIRLGVEKGAVRVLTVMNKTFPYPVSNIQSLFQEPNGRLWMATNRGVYMWSKSGALVNYDSYDGLADDDVNCIRVANDTLWAGTVSGLSCYPLQRQNGAEPFPTFVSVLAYQLGEKQYSISLLDTIHTDKRFILQTDATLVQARITALDFVSNGNFRYECVLTEKLLPLQWWTLGNLTSWIINGFQEKTETNWIDNELISLGVTLPPATYLLKVTAISSSEQRSDAPDEIELVIKPYWYQTLWFWLVIFAALVYGVGKIIRTILANQELNAAVSELRLQAIQAQINPHFIGNSINAIQQFFYPPDPVRASSYIELFTRMLRKTMLFSEQQIILFRDEVAYDRDYLEMIQLRFGQRFQFEITGEEDIPPQTPFPSMMLQPVLENATIHGIAPEGISLVKLQFKLGNGRLTAIITDNGRGFIAMQDIKKNTGSDHKSKGLELLEKKVQTLNQLYNLQMEFRLEDLAALQPSGRGTRVIISFNPASIEKHEKDQRPDRR